jgi:hypothetical protein
MLEGIGATAWGNPQLPVILEQARYLTLSISPDLLGDASPSWREASGGITVLVGLKVPGVPAWTSSQPPVRFANVIVLRPSEVAYKHTIADYDTLEAFCKKLVETPAALLNDLDRPAVF